MTRIKEGLSSLSQTRASTPPVLKNMVGRVYGVVIDKNNPSEEMFNIAGGWNGLGTVFYVDYDQAVDVAKVNLKECKMAKPLFSNSKFYPIVGELVVLIDLPSPSSQEVNDASQKYYIIPINLWNNNHHNAMPASQVTSLGKTFIEKSNINTLQPYEGDHILESRFGSAVRLGSTNRLAPWGKIGEEGSPITVISNGHNFDEKSSSPYVEDINSDKSGLYLTSTQALNIKTDKIKINPLTKPIDISKYSNGQGILVGDRIVLNSKRDEIIAIAKTNIEAHGQIINLNSSDRTHIHSPKVFIGTKRDGTLPDEPLLLGDKTVDLLDNILSALSDFSSTLSSVISTPEGTPILQLNEAADLLSLRLEGIMKNTDSLKSQQNYTI